MSETDDTDDLLLIPPDLFQYEPHFDPYFKIVDGLISQVDRLKNRVEFIESTSELGSSLTLSDSVDMYSSKRYDDSSVSTQSTPQKPRNKFTARSLPNSPNCKKPMHAVRSNDVAPMLGEIDSFISNVKQIKRMNAVRNLEMEFQSTKSLDMLQVDDMLREMEAQHKLIEQKIRQKEQSFHKKHANPSGIDVNTVPDLKYGMRQQMYLEEFSGNTTNLTESTIEKDESDESCTERTQIEALKTVSLGDLWVNDKAKDSPSKFRQKLQEERMRRQHCETAIKELQNRVLELQERVAVAIQVDEAKDRAIRRFHEMCTKNDSRLRVIEKEREMYEEERAKVAKEREEMRKKLREYERESAEASNQQLKTEDVERRLAETRNDLRTAELNSEEFQNKYLQEVEKNEKMHAIIAQKEMDLNEYKKLLNDAKMEVYHTRNDVDGCQNEVAGMRRENESLQNRLEHEKETVRKLNEQNVKLLDEVNANKDLTESLKCELSKTREQLESNKIELKSFYQGQVELLVQNKLKEFQKQLDGAEKNLREEMAKKEMTIAKNAAAHIQQITEKHSLEVKLLEEKHSEESRLHRLQMARTQEELDVARDKLKKQQEKQSNLERQLHRFMETLRQDKTPGSPTTDKEFKSKSFNNIEEIFAVKNDDMRLGTSSCYQDCGAARETPITSRGAICRTKRKESNLQDTIQMLLDKRPTQESKEETAFLQRLSKDMKNKPAWK